MTNPRDIQALPAKTHLPTILDDVEKGETIRITRHGRPVARIVPEIDRRQAEIDQAIANIRALRRHTGKISVEELIAWRHEGRECSTSR
jgi:prevent-host-death family protein